MRLAAVLVFLRLLYLREPDPDQTEWGISATSGGACSGHEPAGRRRANEGMRAGRQTPRPLTRRLLSLRPLTDKEGAASVAARCSPRPRGTPSREDARFTLQLPLFAHTGPKAGPMSLSARSSTRA